MLIFCFLYCLIIVNLTIITEKSYSELPSISRQTIKDYESDWYTNAFDSEKKFNFDASQLYKTYNSLFGPGDINDISSVTLSSKGKILNVTLWLTGPFNEIPKTYIPEYYIKFDVDSNLGTGDEWGKEYLFNIKWNNDTQTWRQIFQEYSNTKNIRIVQQNLNYSNFYSQVDSGIIKKEIKSSDYLNCCYLSIPIDLMIMNYPKSYSISFFVKEKIDIALKNKNLIKCIDENNKNIKCTINSNEINMGFTLNNTKYNITLPRSIEFLDSIPAISIPLPFYQISQESQKINLTQQQKSSHYN